MERRDYSDGSEPSIPKAVDFYTQPMMPYPRINGVCETDVITVEFDWFDHPDMTADTPLKLNHIEAKSRFIAFPMPPGEPGSPENERLQIEACANFKTARNSFAAPSAGDAQWLAAMEREYSTPRTDEPSFAFTCQDFSDSTCAKARAILEHLVLKNAQLIEGVDCPPMRSRDQVNYCYRLTFPYQGTDDPEWELTLIGGMVDGFAPQQIRRAALKHFRRPIVLH